MVLINYDINKQKQNLSRYLTYIQQTINVGNTLVQAILRGKVPTVITNIISHGVLIPIQSSTAEYIGLHSSSV